MNHKEIMLPENEKIQDKTCFIIMPFGEKLDGSGEILNFDDVYDFIIKDAVEGLGIECTRCDRIGQSGSIHADMIEHIYNDDVAIVDITTFNPNVFYELGVRHALKRSVTVLIGPKNVKPPFNIQGLRIIEYDLADRKSYENTRKEIRYFIINGLKEPSRIDSAVYEVLPNLRVERDEHDRLKHTDILRYKLKNVSDKYILLITGDIRNVDMVDIWVNSENTDMQMARYHDPSISGIIRYLGARKTKTGHVKEDLIADELTKFMNESGERTVLPGHVIATGAGELSITHNVKRIFHAASVEGIIGRGYRVIADVDLCISNALRLAGDKEFSKEKLKSILFPLIGTGVGKVSLKIMARKLISAAISYLERYETNIENVCFLTSTKREFDTCRAVLQEAEETCEDESSK